MSGIFNRLELDIMQANELIESIELAMKHNFPAVVVHQGLVGDAYRARGRLRGRFKIISPVDWPKGDNFGTHKFRGLLTDAIEADGFEVCLTGGKSAGDTKNEAKAITEFIKRHIGETTEVRFVLGAFLRDEANIVSMCEGLKGIPTPTFVRIDTQLKLQVSKANTEIHNAIIKKITDIIKLPIKLSGNITGVRAITGCPGAQRFAVNLAQAKTIVKEFQQQPNELKNILNSANGIVATAAPAKDAETPITEHTNAGNCDESEPKM
jgi:hypothetical protein